MFDIRQREEDQTVHYVYGTNSGRVFFTGKAEECLRWIRGTKNNFRRRAKDQAMRDLGLRKVRGALGGVYYE